MASVERSTPTIPLRNDQAIVNFMLETDGDPWDSSKFEFENMDATDVSSDDEPLSESSENNEKLPESAPVPSGSSSASKKSLKRKTSIAKKAKKRCDKLETSTGLPQAMKRHFFSEQPDLHNIIKSWN